VVEQDRARVWAARLAAPAAFFAAAIVLVVLVQSAISPGSPGDDAGPASTAPTTPTATTGSGTTTTTTTPKRKRFYRVQGGDTLESIATKFKTTVDDLLRLNPGIDPLALSPGQRVRIA
jgi:LysM repeat protein